MLTIRQMCECALCSTPDFLSLPRQSGCRIIYVKTNSIFTCILYVDDVREFGEGSSNTTQLMLPLLLLLFCYRHFFFVGFRPIPIRHIVYGVHGIAIAIRDFKNERRVAENCQCTISSIGVNISSSSEIKKIPNEFFESHHQPSV